MLTKRSFNHEKSTLINDEPASELVLASFTWWDTLDLKFLHRVTVLVSIIILALQDLDRELALVLAGSPLHDSA